MPNKRTKKKHTKLKKSAAKKKRPVKKTVRKKLAKKKAALKKSLTKKKPALKKSAVKTRAVAEKTASTLKKRPVRSQTFDTEAFAPRTVRSQSAGQAGDLQGLSNIEGADSESVDELLEEGNAFEADVVAGVERAGDADEREVHTHEVPEDDVPDEYLDKE
jgi:hypothetical protein